MDSVIGFLALCLGVAAIVAAILGAFGLLTVWLWNYAAAGALGLPHLDFWHALALDVLCPLLFGRLLTIKGKK